MKAEILSIGTELLMGQIVNTNARFISELFPQADVYVYYHTVVGDNESRIIECLKTAMARADIIVTTGGLGPTQDDLSKEVVARVLGRKLLVNEHVLERIRVFFSERGRKMCPNNEKQAYFPEGSILIENNMGTAPGCLIEHEGKIIIMLPGPPKEMQPMFSDFVIPYFQRKSTVKLKSRFLKLFGIGESAMEDKIKDLVSSQENPTIAPYAKQGEVTLRVTAKYDQKTQNPDDILNPVIDKIRHRLGQYIYSYDNEELNEVVFRKLVEKKLTVSFAESCTGGLLTKYLTDISGASKVLDSSVVTYSDQSKIRLLCVSKGTLEKYGAVSRQVALEMVKGLQAGSGTDIAVSITGIAGPDGGTEEKPVGLVYIAIGYKGSYSVRKLNLWGDRDRIRHMTCLNAFDLILENITKEEMN
ncbi:MAG: competence/damage-inducible protein A [Clostridia bacterium]|nr:competence/damage-inducible protein A [Clostridia bacterium]